MTCESASARRDGGFGVSLNWPDSRFLEHESESCDFRKCVRYGCPSRSSVLPIACRTFGIESDGSTCSGFESSVSTREFCRADRFDEWMTVARLCGALQSAALARWTETDGEPFSEHGRPGETCDSCQTGCGRSFAGLAVSAAWRMSGFGRWSVETWGGQLSFAGSTAAE